jgi:hypothetical protein
MAAFQLYLQSGKQKSWVGGGTTVMLSLVKNSLVKRECEMMRCYDATTSSSVTKVWDKVFAHFHANHHKSHTVCGIECLAYQDEFLANNPLDVKENDEHTLDFALHLPRLFQAALNQACHSNTNVRFTLSSQNAYIIIARVFIVLSPRSAQN